MKKTAAVIVPNLQSRHAEYGLSSARTVWRANIERSVRWRYTPGRKVTWRGLLRGKLPPAAEAARATHEVIEWQRQRFPGSNITLVLPTGRKLYWQGVAESVASHLHLKINTPGWPLGDKRWTGYFNRLRPGDLVAIDDTFPAGVKLLQKLQEACREGVQLLRYSQLMPEMAGVGSALYPRGLAVGLTQHEDALTGAGAHPSAVLVEDDFDHRLHRIAHELAYTKPDSVLVIEPAVEEGSIAARIQAEDRLTRLLQLLDHYGYGVRVIGAPEAPRSDGSWPVIDWVPLQSSRLPEGWQIRAAQFREAQLALKEHLTH